MENSYVIYGEYMSRIGNKEIIYSEDVQVVMDGNIVKVKGPKGSLERTIPEGITINIDSGKIVTLFNDFGDRYFSAGLWS